MNAAELVRILDTWSDAQNVAEVIGNPWLRVGNGWDLRDWQTVELPDGVKFQRFDERGDVTEEVVVVGDAGPTRQLSGPVSRGTIPTWMLRLSDTAPITINT